VDIIGIVANIGELSDFVSQKSQRKVTKRDVILVDKTAKINVTLWNQMAIDFDEQELLNNPVIVLKAARVSEFGGIIHTHTHTLSTHTVYY